MIYDTPFFRTLLLITALTLPLKAWALWRSAQSEQKWWFIAILIFNTLGILELTYLFYFSKPHKKAQPKE